MKEKIEVDKVKPGELTLSPEGVSSQNFLAKHMGAAVFALICEAGEAAIIEAAKSLTESLAHAGLCATQGRAKGAASDQGVKASSFVKSLKDSVLPLASGIIDTGSGSWSQGVSQKMADGSTLTLTLRAINPQYVAGEEVKKVGSVESALSIYLADNFPALTLIATCQKGIKSKVAPSLLPRVKGKTQKVAFPVEGKSFSYPVLDKKGEAILGEDGAPLVAIGQSELLFDLILGIAE